MDVSQLRDKEFSAKLRIEGETSFLDMWEVDTV